MNKETYPVTTAIRALRAAKIEFTPYLYTYEEHGGTTVSARELGVPEHCVIKTLIMEDDAKKPLIVLMHGDCEVSTKNLARTIGVKTIHPCTPDIADLPRIYINGGKRGFLIGIAPADLTRALKPALVDIAIAHGSE